MKNEPSAFIPATGAVELEHTPVTRSAFERRMTAAMALADDALLRVTVDVGAAVTTARATARRVDALREQIAKHLPLFPLSLIAEFDQTIDALVHAQATYVSDVSKDDRLKALPKLVDECARVRAIALADLESLVLRDIIDAAAVEAIKDGSGRDDLAMDLVSIDAAFTRARAALGERFWVTADEQAYLRKLATTLRETLSLLSTIDEGARERIAIRQRFFTLFVREYDQLRRAVTYVRWDQSDADAIAPSLFLKGKRARVEAPADDDKPAEDKPANNTPADDKPTPHSGATRPVPQDDPFVR
jgi:hypothetical protein